jgi:hypothetical protein
MPRRDDDLDDDDRPARRRPRDDDDDDRPPPRKSNVGLILGIIGGVLLLCCGGGGVGVYFLVKGAKKAVEEAAAKMEDAGERANANNDLKQIGLAVHMYANDNKGDLPNNSYTRDGKPLLSWRVHILPQLGDKEKALYQRFKLDEPWDSANNLPLLKEMPLAYATPAERVGRAPKGTKTYYRGISSPGAVFARREAAEPAPAKKKKFAPEPPAARRLALADFKDGMSQTILVLEASVPVEWTKPDDLDFSPGKPLPSLGGTRANDDNILVLFADGSVRPVRKTNTEAQWRAAATYAGNEPLTLD